LSVPAKARQGRDSKTEARTGRTRGGV
jgi:hypothetical protein